MGHLPIYFLAVADLPPGDGFPQAGAAGCGANPALVGAAVPRDGRRR